MASAAHAYTMAAPTWRASAPGCEVITVFGWSPEVYEFLNAHPRERGDLVNILASAPAEARKVFGERASVDVRVLPDYEGEGEELIVAVSRPDDISVRQADELLMSLYAAWWNNAAANVFRISCLVLDA